MLKNGNFARVKYLTNDENPPKKNLNETIVEIKIKPSQEAF